MANEWNAEGGTNGSGAEGALTNTNSGAGGGWAMSTSIPAGTAITYAAAAAIHGSRGLAFTRTSGTSAAYTQQAVGSVAAAPRRVFRANIKFPTLPSSGIQLFNARNSANGQTSMVEIDATNRFCLKNAVGTTVWTATNPIVANQAYRLDMGVKPGSTTTTGGLDFQYALGDNVAAVQTAALTGQNMGTDPSVMYNRYSNLGAWLGTFYMDDLAWADLASGFIGPFGMEPPNAVSTSRVVYIIDVTDSEPFAGGALSYSVSQTSGPAHTPVLIGPGVWQVDRDPSTNCVYAVTVTEAGGGSDVISVTVPRLRLRELVYSGTAWV